jgi:hypothetical protein
MSCGAEDTIGGVAAGKILNDGEGKTGGGTVGVLAGWKDPRLNLKGSEAGLSVSSYGFVPSDKFAAGKVKEGAPIGTFSA